MKWLVRKPNTKVKSKEMVMHVTNFRFLSRIRIFLYNLMLHGVKYDSARFEKRWYFTLIDVLVMKHFIGRVSAKDKMIL